MRNISKKRAAQLIVYSDIKKNMSNNGNLRCVFSGRQIKGDFDIHHINGERENESLYDEHFLFPCYREYHSLYHSLPFDKLIEFEWYVSFLEFLKRFDSLLWEKEVYKPVKSGLKSIVWYDNLINNT